MLNMRYFILIFLGSFIHWIPAFPQPSTLKEAMAVDTTKMEKLDFSIGLYDYNFTNYGINSSVDFPIRKTSKTRPEWPLLTWLGIMDRSLITLHKQTLLQPNLGFYLVPNNHTGLFANIQMIGRKIWPGGFYREFGLGMQYLRYFYTTTYVPGKEGTFKKEFLPGRSYIAYQASFTLGFDMVYDTGFPAAVFLKPDVYVIAPFNHLFNIGSSIQVGLRYNLINNPFK